MKIWIEMSRDNEHGGGSWSFTHCIWAPTYKKGKRNTSWLFWENVQKVRAGDIVFHLKGEGKKACFSGYSTVDTDGHKTDERPPVPGEWEYCASFSGLF